MIKILPPFNATAYNHSGGCCQVAVDRQGRILRSSALSAGTWDGTPRYDAWFRARFRTVLVHQDMGVGFLRHLQRRAG
jgi:hypothetical protein